MITSTSKGLIKGLTRDLGRMEDCSWIGVQNRDLTKKIAAILQMRTRETRFRRANKGEDAPKKAIQNAKEGTGKPSTTNIDLSIPEGFNVTGVKLDMMMQALLYQGILEQKKKSER